MLSLTHITAKAWTQDCFHCCQLPVRLYRFKKKISFHNFSNDYTCQYFLNTLVEKSILISLLFLKIYLFSVCLYTSLSVCTPRACIHPGRQRGHQLPLILKLKVVLRHPVWVLGTHPDPLQEQQVLLTTESPPRISSPISDSLKV